MREFRTNVRVYGELEASKALLSRAAFACGGFLGAAKVSSRSFFAVFC